MAQTGYTPISIYYSSTATNVPTAGNLVAGELAINTADGKLFYKDSAGVVQVIGTKGGVGSSTTTQVLYNSSGLVVGSANMTFSGTALTLANDASISGLTVGKGGGAVSSNTAVGTSAGGSNTTGVENSYFGYLAANGTTGSYNVGVGAYATQGSGSYNTGLGNSSLASNSTGTQNTGSGYRSLWNNTTGSYNTALGNQALLSNTTASNNTAVGYQAGYTNSTGVVLSAFGYRAGYSYNTNGTETNGSAFFGSQAGYSVTSGFNNNFFGGSAGYSMTTGSKNTIIGAYSGNQGGLDIRTASNYIVLSDGDGNPNAYCDNLGRWNFGVGGTSSSNTGQVRINGASGSGLGWFIDGLNNGTRTNLIGNYSQIAGGTATWLTLSNTGGGVYLNGATATSWTAVSDETRKDIIEPITGGLAKVATLRTVIGKLKTDEEGVRRPYLIAQDVQKVLPEAVSESEDKEGKVLGLSYTEVIPLLVNAIQELKVEVDSLKQQLGK
jgi:hypothetical protein